MRGTLGAYRYSGGMRRQGRVITAVSVLTLLTGCAPWLAADPKFAADSARNPDSGPVTSSTAAAGAAGAASGSGTKLSPNGSSPHCDKRRQFVVIRLVQASAVEAANCFSKRPEISESEKRCA